ncbi:MAG TPA: glutamine-hydrolyzing carbamoyl-phosphate synthase small subunit [Chloroflexota bacterium]|nr:glutamine-hydrolyzing carbamoyl-phosphate synthase small subunit [Chloroflexota bacterium]
MAVLALEDGAVWEGDGFGARTERVGEVVFNTSLSGYQEVLTDPSYAGQMVVMTAPQIGNTGINLDDVESSRPAVEAFIVRELSPVTSNWRSSQSLDDYLAQSGLPGISGINTRALTLHLRTYGALRGAISTRPDADARALVAAARAWPGLTGRDLVQDVSCATPYVWEDAGDTQWGLSAPATATRPRVALFDYGAKRNIMRRLTALGCEVLVVPATSSLEAAEEWQPAGWLLSNGPGDPAGLPYAVQTTARLLERGAPTLGICLGHQLIGLALGGNTFKLKFGHHGSNQPVKELDSGKVRITSQNHNYAVDPAGLPAMAELTERNLNDGTLEGLRLRDRPVWSVQYHPEASPGPHDADDVLAQFVRHLHEHAA